MEVLFQLTLPANKVTGKRSDYLDFKKCCRHLGA